MFSRKDTKWFATGGICCLFSFGAFAFDPVTNGFGWLTLWFGPIVFMTGIAAVVPGILGPYFRIPQQVLNMRSVVAVGMFGAALILYVITLEPTASLWDCSEFIASAYKLQVPHTPGNPLLLVIGRVFSMMAGDNPQLVAWSINFMSAFFSAGTVALVYLLILFLADKISGNKSVESVIAGVVGASIIAVSDTFWFSAVEAETYAASSFFMMLLLYLTLAGNETHGDLRKRMLVLILYIAGLAFCIHPMCVLALPILPVTWMLKNRAATGKNLFIAISAGVVLVLFINRFVAVGIFELVFFTDLFLVNGLSLPFYSGAVAVLIGGTVLVRWVIRAFQSTEVYSWAGVFFLLAFAPYIALFIRSAHNPPIDESNPEDLPLIKAYMNREGYPTRPLLYGPYFDAEIQQVEPGLKVYYKDDGRYNVAGNMSEYEYAPEQQTIFPRMYSNDENHIATYRQWTGLTEKEKPTFLHNVTFMMKYQLGHMYFRYLLFNFAGRKSDVQGEGWLKPWEALQEEDKVLRTKARNQYWMVPLGLGFAGMIFLYKRDKRSFATLAIFFAITGAFLAVYLNATPNEPRERDYIYVGSYLAFAIFAGVGVSGIAAALSSKTAARIVIGALMLVPIWMLVQNFDDHNRRGRTLQIDNARNVLASCEPNSILFTGGDNDTFPLWYLQDVEGFRTDVRVMVLSYMNTDWYINQLRKQFYSSPAFRFTLDRDAYRQYGANDVLYVQKQFDQPVDLAKFLELLQQDHPALRVETADKNYYSVIPSHSVFLGSSPSTTASDGMPDKTVLTINQSYLTKNGLAILDILLNNPDRPMHFNFTSIMQTGLDLEKFAVQKGQIFEIALGNGNSNGIDLETSYKNLMEKMDYENLLNESFYLSYEDHQLRIVQPLRMSMNALADALIEQGKSDDAVKVLNHALSYLYRDHLKPSFANVQTADLLTRVGMNKEAQLLSTKLFEYAYALAVQDESDSGNIQLARIAAGLLNKLGKPEYEAKLENHGMLSP
jgi:hypothetical protein